MRNTAKVSFISFLSLAIIIGGCIRTIVSPSLITLALTLLIAAILIIPYCVLLAFGKPKEIMVLASEAKAPETPDAVIEEIQPEEISLIEEGQQFVFKAAEAFSKPDGAQELMDTINKKLVEITKADGGVVLLVDDFEDVISVKSYTGEFPPPYKLPADLPHKPIRVSTSFKFAQFPLRENIFGEVASAGKAELITHPEKDDRIYQNSPEDFLRCGTYIFVPLKQDEIVTGLVGLARKRESEEFSIDDLNHAKTLCDFASTALRTVYNFQEYKEQQEMTKESDIATDLQKNYIIKKMPVLPGVSLGCFTDQTAGVCSDLYDIVPSRKDRTSFVLMDVAGKGTNALLVMTMIRAMLRLIVNTTQSAGTILTWANKGICSENSGLDHFASVTLINYDDTKKKIQFASSGTNQVHHFIAAKNEITRVSVPCEPIGVEKSTVYKDIEFTGSKGDIIIVFTDGLVEALNDQGQQYSSAHLANIVKANNKLPGKDIAAKVKDDIKKFLGTEKLHDDQTLLVVKIQ
ncbi:MAG: SpoIIE family protein phosphatase [Treponema sp.]|nr:SpoIIE family protein phosphatase [Treponema sp.]